MMHLDTSCQYLIWFCKIWGTLTYFFTFLVVKMSFFICQKKRLRQINLFCPELSFEYLFAFCKIWGILTCFWVIWLSKCHLSFARKTLEANQFVLSRALIWVPICVLQNLRHFDMFLTLRVQNVWVRALSLLHFADRPLRELDQKDRWYFHLRMHFS